MPRMNEDYEKEIAAKNNAINAQIALERKKNPNQVTDKEIELICSRKSPPVSVVADDIGQCINRHASVEQLADIMEKVELPIFERGKNIWAAFYANVASAEEDDRIADKIIKAVELWGKKGFYRYEKVIDFYAQIIKPKDLEEIVSKSFKPEYRMDWFDRPEQVAQMVKSANNLLKECAKDEDRLHSYNYNDFMRASDKMLDAVYYSGVSSSDGLAKATAGFLQTNNQVKRKHLEKDIEESMNAFRENFPCYVPTIDSKTSDKGDSR